MKHNGNSSLNTSIVIIVENKEHDLAGDIKELLPRHKVQKHFLKFQSNQITYRSNSDRYLPNLLKYKKQEVIHNQTQRQLGENLLGFFPLKFFCFSFKKLLG